ncbi:MAG: adenylate/guanylate cyclase domain-containing protein [Thermoanaerobaculaceae bacterium]|nr:adenylate/guanylate cyclase domain-containing protein [Thermoanaerobaculaceae bacterium]TAM56715.1 MAG: FHA domain-containing protein [Acidobacteriota bacterium]
MPELRWTEGDVPRRLRLVTSPSGIGRASDNQLVLKDFSVSRHHARVEKRGDTWWIVDLGSTNGIKINDRYATDAMLTEGDQVQVGNFTLSFHRGDSSAGLSASSSTFLRTLEEFREDFALEPEQVRKGTAVTGATPRERVLESLAQVARTLLEVEELEPVLVKVMEAVFGQLPAERAYILLFNPEGQAELRIARSRGGAALAEAPVSQTILDLVSRQKVAVLTSDAQSDERFAAGLSVRLHQIRSAMCAPLWHRDAVIGVLFVDTPLAAGCFTAENLDLLTALANYAAVAIDRARLNDHIREARRARERLERYHSPAVVEAIVGRHRGAGDAERHETREVSVLFADLVGFTARCEGMDPPDVARFLGEFFTLASDSVFEFGGTLDKFIGDAAMAFFGAPLAQPDHAERAVLAALALRRRLKTWNRERVLAGLDVVEVRMAINSGLVVVGEIGSATRVDYTVLGNTVNVAARLEEIVAQAGQIVLGAATQRGVAHLFPTEHLGNVQLRGLQGKLPVFRLMTEEITGVGE